MYILKKADIWNFEWKKTTLKYKTSLDTETDENSIIWDPFAENSKKGKLWRNEYVYIYKFIVILNI